MGFAFQYNGSKTKESAGFAGMPSIFLNLGLTKRGACMAKASSPGTTVLDRLVRTPEFRLYGFVFLIKLNIFAGSTRLPHF